MKYPRSEFHAAFDMPEDACIPWLVAQPNVREWLMRHVHASRNDKVGGRPRLDDTRITETILAAVPEEAAAMSQADLMRVVMSSHRSKESTLRRIIKRLVDSGRLIKSPGAASWVACKIYASKPPVQ